MWTHKSHLVLISDSIYLWLWTVLTLTVSNKQEQIRNRPYFISTLPAVQIKENFHLSRIVYLKKRKKNQQLFAKLPALLAQSSVTRTSLLPSLSFCPYPKDTIVFNLLNCLAALFWLFYCFVLAACIISDTRIWAYSPVAFTGNHSGKACLLNAQNVIPTLSVVSAALFRLEFVSNVFGLILDF